MKCMKIVVMFLVFVISGCGDERIGSSNFFISTDRSHRDLFEKRNGKAAIVVDENIADYSVSSNYLHVLRLVAVSYDCVGKKGSRTIHTHYTDIPEYWLIDLAGGKNYGPLSLIDYKHTVRALGLTVTALSATTPVNTVPPLPLTELRKCEVLTKLENAEYTRRYMDNARP